MPETDHSTARMHAIISAACHDLASAAVERAEHCALVITHVYSIQNVEQQGLRITGMRVPVTETYAFPVNQSLSVYHM
jgi:rRNA maturation endonuclease Nob1